MVLEKSPQQRIMKIFERFEVYIHFKSLFSELAFLGIALTLARGLGCCRLQRCAQRQFLFSDLLEIETALPEIKTTLTEIKTALPEMETTLTEIKTNLTEIKTAMTEIEILSCTAKTIINQIKN